MVRRYLGLHSRYGHDLDVADADYLHYGFWLKKTTDADGAVTYNEVETFAGSSLPQSGDR